MIDEDILRMAREAGFQDSERDGWSLGFKRPSLHPVGHNCIPELIQFAELVAAAEREACAKVAEGFAANRDWVPGSLWGNIRAEVAAAIRSRAMK